MLSTSGVLVSVQLRRREHKEETRSHDDGSGCRLGEKLETRIEIGVPTVNEPLTEETKDIVCHKTRFYFSTVIPFSTSASTGAQAAFSFLF